MLEDVSEAIEEKKEAKTLSDKIHKNVKIAFVTIGTLAFLFQGLVAYHKYKSLKK